LVTEVSASIGAVLRPADTDIRVPALCDIEVAAGLRRALLRGLLPPERAALALDQYSMLPLTRHDHRALLVRVLELRSNFSAYDACYVALAERLKADLLTADEPLARAVRTHTAIRLLP
jgi:predicted nucleic acid-binding protein